MLWRTSSICSIIQCWINDKFESSYEGIKNTKQGDQLKESSCQYQARMEVDLISIRQVLTICPFVHSPKGKKHPNRCACDVGTLIWRHQANHKCKHISLVWECFVFNPEVLLLWPEDIFHSSYRKGMSGKDKLLCLTALTKKKGYTERYGSHSIESWV